jgi:hypothetical protein
MPHATTPLDDLVARHTERLGRAMQAAHDREFHSAYDESPSPRVYGDGAAEAGQRAYDALLGTPFDLPGHPEDGTPAGREVSPYGPRLGEHLIATAVERDRFGRSGLYDVTVRRDDEVIAEFRGRTRVVAQTQPGSDGVMTT